MDAASELLATSPLPVSAIRSAGGVTFFSAFDPKATLSDPPGDQGVFRIDGDATTRVCTWPWPSLITIDDHHVYFANCGCIRRVRVAGGDVRRVLMNANDLVVDGDRLFGAGYTFLVRMSRRATLDTALDLEDSDMTHFDAKDPRRLAVDATHVYATLGDPPYTRGSGEVLVRIPKEGGAPVTIAHLRAQVVQMAVVGRTVVLLLHDGPIVTVSTDGGAIREIPETENAERFQVVGDAIHWVPPSEPRARLVAVRVTGGPSRTVAELGLAQQPPFWVTNDHVVWAEPAPSTYRESGRQLEHRILRTHRRDGASAWSC
jgi:hypothetical protein